MKFFDCFKRKSNIGELVRQGLANSESATVKQIGDCIFLLREALGDTWQAASKEAAAGMALVALARDAHLQQYLNGNGWRLVMAFVTANPEMASNLSPRTIGDIFDYRHGGSAVPALPA